MGVSENRGPCYSTLNSRILIKKGPKIRYPPYFPKLPNPIEELRIAPGAELVVSDIAGAACP